MHNVLIELTNIWYIAQRPMEVSILYRRDSVHILWFIVVSQRFLQTLEYTDVEVATFSPLHWLCWKESDGVLGSGIARTRFALRLNTALILWQFEVLIYYLTIMLTLMRYLNEECIEITRIITYFQNIWTSKYYLHTYLYSKEHHDNMQYRTNNNLIINFIN